MNQQLPPLIHHVVDRLQTVEGIVAISMGGSRARGNHTPKSDVDLGLYYQLENRLIWLLSITLPLNWMIAIVQT